MEKPKLRSVEVLDCFTRNGKRFCPVEIVPLLLNEEDMKNYIEAVSD